MRYLPQVIPFSSWAYSRPRGFSRIALATMSSSASVASPFSSIRSVNLKFRDGKIGRSTTTFDARMPYRFHIGIYGTEGTLRDNELFAPKLLPGQHDFTRIPCVLPDSGDVTHHPFQGEVSHLLDCIIENRRPFPDIEDAALTQAVCFAADQSAESGRPVLVSDFEKQM